MYVLYTHPKAQYDPGKSQPRKNNNNDIKICRKGNAHLR